MTWVLFPLEFCWVACFGSLLVSDICLWLQSTAVYSPFTESLLFSCKATWEVSCGSKRSLLVSVNSRSQQSHAGSEARGDSLPLLTQQPRSAGCHSSLCPQGHITWLFCTRVSVCLISSKKPAALALGPTHGLVFVISEKILFPNKDKFQGSGCSKDPKTCF